MPLGATGRVQDTAEERRIRRLLEPPSEINKAVEALPRKLGRFLPHVQYLRPAMAC